MHILCDAVDDQDNARYSDHIWCEAHRDRPIVRRPPVPLVPRAPLRAVREAGAASAVRAGGRMSQTTLDPCCGSRMMWFDRTHPDVVACALPGEWLSGIQIHAVARPSEVPDVG